MKSSLYDGLKGLWPYIQPYKSKLIWGIVLAGGLTMVGMLPPLVMRRLVNDVASEGQYGLLPMLLGALFGITILRSIMTYFNARTIAYVGQHIVRNIREDVFAHLLKLPLRFHEKTPVGALMQRTMGDVGAVQNLVTGHLVNLVVDFVTAAFAIWVMISISPKLTLVSLGLLPVFYLNYLLFTKKIQANNIELRGHMDHISSMLQERLSSHDLIVSYSQEDESAQHFRDRARANRDTALRGVVYNMGFNHATAFINGSGATIVYVVSVYLYIKGTLQYGDVIAFAAYSTQLMGPVVRFIQILQQSNQALVSIQRVDQVLHEKPEVVAAEGITGDTKLDGDLRFADYTYKDPEDGQVVLDSINLHVPGGMNLTVVGPPASGKTTLLAALRRMIDPCEGALYVSDVDVREIDLQKWQSNAPTVRDSTAIFRGTIRSNLKYGAPDGTDDEIWSALETVGMADFVRRLQKGLDARIGPGGIRMSAGQRQRLGIARALVSKPKVVILDEATAALDPASASELLERVYESMKETTIINVARRLGVAAASEMIVVVVSGKVVETGTHSELLEKENGVYRGLYEEQYGGV